MQDIYEKFEFQKIRDEIAKSARTELGKMKANSLSMFPDPTSMKRELHTLDEMISLLDRYGIIPLDVSSSLFSSVSLAKKGGTLSIEELERCAHDVLEARQIKRYFKQVTESPILLEYSSRFPILDFLEKDIHKIIAPDMSIYDNASPKLKSIRASIHRLENEMKKKLGFILDQNKTYLSDSTLTIRNGHYVLPVANAYKNKVKGIIQDVSGSGETTFIEPDLLVSMNNKMVELHNDEREEIHRLLGVLSEEVAGSSDALLQNNEMIGYLDFLQAKALYANQTKSHVAKYSETPLIDVHHARHPLIDPSKVVANDFELSEDNHLIIISGPNAGGKTVALKTIGILVLMSQCGLAIPASEGPSLSYFKHIYVDIGDSQSLSDNLSTFSGHMRNLSEILSNVGGRDLVLLDEVGTGTSPKEGEAIAYSVILFLMKKHAFTLISSHFEGLKAFALSTKGIANASMVFDEENLLPTYKLKMGLPGESYGLVVAKRFGIPDEVLNEAKQYASSHENLSVSEAIKKLSEVSRKAEEEKQKAIEKENELTKRLIALEKRENELAKREKNYLSDVEKKKNDMLEEYEEKMERILRSVQREDIKLHEVIGARHKLMDLKEEAEEERYSGEVKVGDYVNIPSVYASGRISALSGNKVTVVTKEGLSFHTKKDKVIRVEPPKEEKRQETSALKLDQIGIGKSTPLELNLIGQHVDEAKLNLDKYLDECRYKGLKRVRIIHGWGSGALRRLVQDYCLSHKDFIASFEGADGNEGGGGATIVHLK